MRLNILLFSNNIVEMNNLTANAIDMAYADYNNRIADINKLQGEYISRVNEVNANVSKRISELLKNYTRSFESIPYTELKKVYSKEYTGGLAQAVGNSKSFVRANSDIGKSQVSSNKIDSYVSAYMSNKPPINYIDVVPFGGKAPRSGGVFRESVSDVVKPVKEHLATISSSIGEGFTTVTATANSALKGIDFDKVEFSLEEVSKTAQDLKNALARIEGNINKVVDFSFLDKDINREKDKLKNKNKELIDDYDAKRKKAIAYLSGSDGQGGIVGKLKEDLKRTINVRNAILEAEGISAELYDEQYGDYISNIEKGADEYISSINDSFGDFVAENDVNNFTAEENKNVKDAYEQINKIQDDYKGQVEKEKENVVEAYQKDLDKQKAILEQEKNKTISQYQEELAKQKAEVEQQKAILEQEKEKTISQYQEEMQKQQAEVEQQKAILEQEQNKTISQYQEEMQKQQADVEQQKAILEQQKNNTINQYQTEMQNVQKQYQTELQNAQNQYQAELQNAQTQYNSELQKATAEIEANKMQYQNEVNAALQEYQNSLNSQLQNIQMMNFLNN